MAFTQCMRDHGLEVLDPVIDTDGNVQKPELAEGAQVNKEAWGEAFEACGDLINGVTWAEKQRDRSAEADYWGQIATCLREKGYGLDDPTAETLDAWLGDLKAEFNWDDPDAQRDWEDCSSSGSNSKGSIQNGTKK